MLAKIKGLLGLPKFKVDDIVEVEGMGDIPFMVRRVKPGPVYEVRGAGPLLSVKEEMLRPARLPAGAEVGWTPWGSVTK